MWEGLNSTQTELLQLPDECLFKTFIGQQLLVNGHAWFIAGHRTKAVFSLWAIFGHAIGAEIITKSCGLSNLGL
jgi:hypothetical protein